MAMSTLSTISVVPVAWRNNVARRTSSSGTATIAPRFTQRSTGSADRNGCFSSERTLPLS